MANGFWPGAGPYSATEMPRVTAKHGYSGWLVIEAEQDPALRAPFAYQSMGLKALKEIARKVGLDKGQKYG